MIDAKILLLIFFCGHIFPSISGPFFFGFGSGVLGTGGLFCDVMRRTFYTTTTTLRVIQDLVRTAPVRLIQDCGLVSFVSTVRFGDSGYGMRYRSSLDYENSWVDEAKSAWWWTGRHITAGGRRAGEADI